MSVEVTALVGIFPRRKLPTRFLNFCHPSGHPDGTHRRQTSIGAHRVPRGAFWGHHTGWGETGAAGCPPYPGLRLPTALLVGRSSIGALKNTCWPWRLIMHRWSFDRNQTCGRGSPGNNEDKGSDPKETESVSPAQFDRDHW